MSTICLWVLNHLQATFLTHGRSSLSHQAMDVIFCSLTWGGYPPPLAQPSFGTSKQNFVEIIIRFSASHGLDLAPSPTGWHATNPRLCRTRSPRAEDTAHRHLQGLCNPTPNLTAPLGTSSRPPFAFNGKSRRTREG